MKFYPIVLLAVAIFVEQPVGADEKEVDLAGFSFRVPTDWKRVDKKSEFVDEDGLISPKFFDLNGKQMPITVTARRTEREPELTEKNIEEKLKGFVKESLIRAKGDLAAPDHAGPKVSEEDLEGCGLTTRKVGKKPIYTSTFIISSKEKGDESLITKATTVTYVEGDSIYVLMIIGIVQHYRVYAEEIREIAESAKPKSP